MAARRGPSGGPDDGLFAMLAVLAVLAVLTPLAFRAATTWVAPQLRSSTGAAGDWLSRWWAGNWWLVAFWTVGLAFAWLYRRRLKRRQLDDGAPVEDGRTSVSRHR